MSYIIQLRSLAFGGGGGGKPSTAKSGQNTSALPSHKQYEEWVGHDKDQVDELYQQELQQALLMSKVESEKSQVRD